MKPNKDAGLTQRAPREWKRVLLLGALLVVGWLLWSGLYKPLLLGLGVVSCLLTLYVIRRMGYFENDTYAFHYQRGMTLFWLWLGIEVVRSSLEVARIVLRPRLQVEPKTVTIDASDLSLVGRALLGNAITLTPGTLTMDVDRGQLLVHALTEQGAQQIQQGEMLRRVRGLGSK